MGAKVLIVLAIVFGAVAFGATLAAYIYGGGFSGPFSDESGSWAAFGSYFGGVLGPVMGFGSILLLVTTILVQDMQVRELKRENLKQSHLRYFDTLYHDIQYLMERELPTGKFGEMILSGQPLTTGDPRLLRALTSRLLRLVAEYAEALALYRDNIDAYFEFKAHRARLQLFVRFLEHSSLEGVEPATLGFIRKHLDE